MFNLIKIPFLFPSNPKLGTEYIHTEYIIYISHPSCLYTAFYMEQNSPSKYNHRLYTQIYFGS